MKRKVLLTAAVLLYCVGMSAQKNPVGGYIITLEGDTIKGTVDFLSREKSAKACLFKSNDSDTFTSYLPTQLSGYGLADNGVIFQTKFFPVDGVDQWIFAEKLLQGCISLFRYEKSKNDAWFYLINEANELAVVTDPGDLEDYTPDDAFDIKLKTLKPAMAIFDQSEKAKNKLWKKPITAENMVLITREYNREFCQDNNVDDDFVYNAKKSSAAEPHFYIEAGGYFGKLHIPDAKPDVNGFHVALGGEWFFPRVNNHVSMQALLSLDKVQGKGDDRLVYINNDPAYISWKDLNFYDIQVQLGATYRLLPKQKATPMVCGGILLRAPYVNDKFSDYSDFLPENKGTSILPFDYGVYLGAGLEVRLGKQRLNATVRYELPLQKSFFAAEGFVASIGLSI